MKRRAKKLGMCGLYILGLGIEPVSAMMIRIGSTLVVGLTSFGPIGSTSVTVIAMNLYNAVDGI